MSRRRMAGATVLVRPGVAIVVDLLTFPGGVQKVEASLSVANPSPPYAGALPLVATVPLDDPERIELAVESAVDVVRLKMAAALGAAIVRAPVVEDRTQR